MSDLRSRILAVDDRPYEDVEVPEWEGMTVRVRGLSAKAAEAFAKRHGGADTEGGLADLLIDALEDPTTGEPIFTRDDLDALSDKAIPALAMLSKKAMGLSGLGDEEDAKND